jgi:hypothetical protein
METLPALQEQHIQSLISQALDKQVPVEVLERLLTMREKLKAEYAREEYNKALAQFQAECPIIKKTKRGATGMYAPLDSIITQIKDLLQKCGFSYQFKSYIQDNTMTQICIVRHTAGHQEEFYYSSHFMPMNKATTEVQADGGTNTYTKRYAFCNAFGIMTSDFDNDGARVKGEESVTVTQIEELERLLKQAEVDMATILKKWGVDELKDLTFNQALATLSSLQKYIG